MLWWLYLRWWKILNAEKWRNEILAILNKNEELSVRDGRPAKCEAMVGRDRCDLFDLEEENNDNPCQDDFIRWLISDYNE